MRTPIYIIEHYLTQNGYKLKEFREKLNSSNEQYKLTTAMTILGINEIQFEKIPFLIDKKEFLDYKYYLVLFETYHGNFIENHWIHLDEFRQLAKLALQTIKNSKLISQHKNEYSIYSQSLSHIHQKSERYEGSSKDLYEASFNDMLASTINIGPKKGGVEPGFMATHLSDIVSLVVQKCDANEEKILTFIDNYSGDLEKIYAALEKELPEYMYKHDYETNSTELPYKPGQTPVYLSKNDVKRTSSSKKIYEFMGDTMGDIFTVGHVFLKNTTAYEINKNSIYEVLSNDIASIFMPAQKQKLYKTTYKNNALKFMPHSLMVKGSLPFGDRDKRPLRGGGDDSNNYRSRKLMMPRNGITTLTDNRISNAGSVLIPLLATGDYDKVGSQGQNLLVLEDTMDYKTGENTWKIVGIDFGHCFTGNNPLLEQKLILADGRFSQPLFSSAFKNFSALTDAPVSQIMQGAINLAIARGNIQISNTVINSHGKEFAEFVKKITPGECDRVCDDQIDNLQTFASLNIDDEAECNMLIETVNDYKKTMHYNIDETLIIVKQNLLHPAKIIDLADHLNKRCATIQGKTTLRSNNKSHGLNHLIINKNYTKTWSIDFSDTNHYYTLSCPFTGNELKTVKAELERFKSSSFTIQIDNNKASIMFHQKDADKVCEIFHESHLQNEYFKSDAAAIRLGKLELRLRDFIKAPWFKEKNFLIDLRLKPDNKKQYQLRFSAFNNKEMDNVLCLLVQEKFQIEIQNNRMHVDFNSEEVDLIKMIGHFEKIQNTYELLIEQEKEKEQARQNEILSQSIIMDQHDNNINQLPFFMTNSFIGVSNSNTLLLLKSALFELLETRGDNSIFLSASKNITSLLWTTPKDTLKDHIATLKTYIYAEEPENIDEIYQILKGASDRPENEMITIRQALNYASQILDQNWLRKNVYERKGY